MFKNIWPTAVVQTISREILNNPRYTRESSVLLTYKRNIFFKTIHKTMFLTKCIANDKNIYSILVNTYLVYEESVIFNF